MKIVLLLTKKVSSPMLHYLIFFLGVGSELGDPDNRDETGCPKIFKKKCNCGKQQTYLWHPERNDTFVVNCTNTG